MSLRWRRHNKLLVMPALVAAVPILGLGDQRIVSCSVQDGDDERTVTSVLDVISQRGAALGGSVVLSEEMGYPSELPLPLRVAFPSRLREHGATC